MRQSVSAILCILAIITGTNAQRPYLSSSYSYQGTAVSTITDGAFMSITTYTRFDTAIDTTRGLVYVDINETTSGIPGTIYEITSVNDNTFLCKYISCI